MRRLLSNRPLIILLGFALATWAAELATRSKGLTLLEPYRNEARAEKLWAYLGREEVEDVLIIGSSRVQGGIDVPIVEDVLARLMSEEVDVYKLGIPGLRSIDLAELVRDGVAHRPPSKLLVLAIEPRFFASVVNRRNARPLPGEAAVIGEWEGESLANSLTRRFQGIEALWNLPWIWSNKVQSRSEEIRARSGEDRTLEERLAQERQRAAAYETAPDLFELAPNRTWQWPDQASDAMASFRLLLDVLDELSCEVVFVQMPLTPGFAERLMPVVSQRMRDEVVAALQARGHSFHALQGAPYPTKPEHFFSLTHVNREGTLQTSAVFPRHILAPILRGEEPRELKR